jgi:hypothetical protein
MKGEVEIN